MSQTLQSFMIEQQEKLQKFEIWWNFRHQKDPENFPMAMVDGNEGLWWEQFQDFDISRMTEVDGYRDYHAIVMTPAEQSYVPDDSIASRARVCIANTLGLSIDEVQFSKEIISDLGADEIDIVELAMAIEEEFKIEVADEAMAKVTTVGELMMLVQISCDKEKRRLRVESN